MQHWIESKSVQVAPQETEVESYIIGGIKQDVKSDTFAGFKLWLQYTESQIVYNVSPH